MCRRGGGLLRILEWILTGSRLLSEVTALLHVEGALPPRPVLATFHKRPTLTGEPAAQFEAKLVPFEVAEGGLRVCLQKAGEDRFVEAPAGRAQAIEARGGDLASASSSGIASGPRPRRAEGAWSDRGTALGTEMSFVVSETTASLQPCTPRTRTVEVQTSPAEPSPRPPPMPGLGELAALRVRRAKRRAKVRLKSSIRQVPGFEETPRQTRVLRLQDALGGINACGRGCCVLHISAAAARQTLDDIDREVCGSVEFGCQQFPECLALIDPEDSEEGADGSALQECETCGKGLCPRPPRGSSTHAASDETHQEALARTPCSRASMFKVTLDRSGGAKLGLDLNLDSNEGLVLLVERVGEGLVEQWNSSNEQADVRSGDYLVQVNGVDGSSMRMLAELREDKLLEIVVLRSDAI